MRIVFASAHPYLPQIAGGSQSNTHEMAMDMRVSRSTARTHVQNVLLKVGVHSGLRAVALDTQRGQSR